MLEFQIEDSGLSAEAIEEDKYCESVERRNGRRGDRDGDEGCLLAIAIEKLVGVYIDQILPAM